MTPGAAQAFIPEDRPLRWIIEDLRRTLAQKEVEIEHLRRLVVQKDERIQALEEEIRLLKHRLGQTSQNSHNPPSSDRFVKPRSLRRPTGRAPGGQPGHSGATLRQVPEKSVDEICVHPAPILCRHCGSSLEDAPEAPVERRQVFDLPEIRLRVVEHRLAGKRCRSCGNVTRAEAPRGVEQPAQYGPGVAALAVYFQVHQIIPFDRLRQLFSDLFHQPISTGTLTRMLHSADHALVPVEAEVRQQLHEAPVANFDETGIRNGKNLWLHVTSTDRLTLLQVHSKRGREALEAIHVLPNFRGVAVHDCYASCFGYTDCTHALCNAHIRRELEAARELTGQAWPRKLDALLLDALRMVEAAKARGESALPLRSRRAIHAAYAALVNEGRALNPIHRERSPGQRGRLKKSKVQNLLERLSAHEDAVLRFVDDFRVPFTNNRAEQDLRMAKVKQKVSGGFRTYEGACRYARIRSYLSTARKCGVTPIEALHRLFQGPPFMPTRAP